MRSGTAASILAVVIVPLAGMLAPSGDARAALTSAVEFWHGRFGSVFLATSPDEIAKLDSGAIEGWMRLATEFKVDDEPGPGLVPVCRFFSTRFAAKGSHFFTAFADECTALKANPDWTYEGEAFHVRLPDAAGRCPAGTMPIFRGYNGGEGGAPAHRFSPFPEERCLWGWACTPEGSGAEGVAFCAPESSNLAQQRTQQLAGGTWEFRYVVGGNEYREQLRFASAVPVAVPGQFPFAAAVIGPGGGAAGWNPVASKITFLRRDLMFQFDFGGGDDVTGCAFFVGFDGERWTCFPLTGHRR